MENSKVGGRFEETEIEYLDDDAFEQINMENAFSDMLEYKRFSRTSSCNDFEAFLTDLVRLLNRELLRIVRERRCIRVSVCVHATYEKASKPDAEPIQGYLRTELITCISEHAISHVVHRTIETIRLRHVNFMREASGLRLTEVTAADIYVTKFNPLVHVGQSYTELPPFLAHKKAIINVQNADNRCFAYALLSALHPLPKNASRSKNYDKYFSEHPVLSQIAYPVELGQLEQIERKITIPFNVYSFFDDEGRGRYPVYLSKLNQDTAIDLLFWSGHFAWIKNFSRFLGDTCSNEHARVYCKRCLGHFYTEQALSNHQLFCKSIDDCKQIFTMPEVGTQLSFYNVRFQQLFPFIIYADFEALTVPCDVSLAEKRRNGIPVHTAQTHKPISVGLKLVSTVPGVLDTFPYEAHVGEDAAEWFLRRLLEYRVQCYEYLFDEKRMVMTDDDRREFETAAACYICGKSFQTSGDTRRKSFRKVRDHDHITGAYRGPAHSSCNLRLRTTYKLPIFLHNFRNYDGHIIVPAFTCFRDTKLTVIGQGLEKYVTLTWDDTLVFKDSLQFLNNSLELLVECLLKAGKHNFKQLCNSFTSITDEDGIDLLLRKGVYPYDYMSSRERLDDDHLPPREAFYSRLLKRECSEDDYAHAQRVWQKFECKTLRDYHDLYLKTDVLLLADVFESFRVTTLKAFGLDPSYYVSAPQLSWDCMMKMTGCKLTLLSDPAMFEIMNRNLRGGISVITKRHAQANNKYMGAAYDPSKRSSYILYLDANNLYGWAMSEPLPYDDFNWVSATECEEIDWRIQADDQEYGYFVEVDLHYPDALHDSHNDYPLAPERVVVEEQMLSERQLDLRAQYSMSHCASSKLIPNFFDKKEMLLHYRTLRFYLEHGMTLTKVHKAIRFKQARWLQPYIQTNTEMRAKTKDPVEGQTRKFSNNAIYGKACENLTKRTDVKLVNSRRACEKLINKPHCRRFRIFTGELAAIEMQKVKCQINKPTYVAFAVLELSKLHMYKFHYDHLRTWYADAELLFTDTDSLVYQIYTDDLYADLALHRDHFDFSNYPPEHALFGGENKMVLGKMKDESNGSIITEFVGLRPKMYSYTTMEATPTTTTTTATTSVKLKEAKRAKGIQRAAIASLRHADYLEQLRVPTENYVNIRRIGQRHHRVYTLDSMKRGLCAFDDKRYLLPDGVHTRAHGHFSIREQQKEQHQEDAEEDESNGSVLQTSQPAVVLDTEDEYVTLTAESSAQRNIRTRTRREALSAVAGVDLRSAIATVTRRRATRLLSSPPAKRARQDEQNSDSDDSDSELCIIDEVAQFVVHNDAY
jgi:hypothetical protein